MEGGSAQAMDLRGSMALKSDPRFDSLRWRTVFRQTDLPGKSALLISSCFGLGFLPGAPGTYTSLAAIPLALCLGMVPSAYGIFILSAFVMIALWACQRAWSLVREEDPPWIVIDEAAGLCLSLLLVRPSWANLALGFLLFRVFDIWKPYPVKMAEKRRGGWGILLDDLFAGVFANLSLRVILLII